MRITPILSPLKQEIYKQFKVPDLKGGILHLAEEFPIEKTQKLIEISNDSFNEWKLISNNEKSNIFKEFANNLKQSKEEIVKEHLKVGISPAFADFNVEGSINQVEHYSELIKTLINKEDINGGIILKEPLGPILSISPWNAPGILATRAIMAPLSAGCSVILKGSHLSPEVTYLISKAFMEVKGNLPSGILQTIHTSSERSKDLINEIIKNPLIKGLNFTGSTKTGKEIAETAGKWLKPCILELGGKNCTIIDKGLEKDQLTKAVKESIISGLFNTGQVCMCTDTIYIPNSQKDEIENMISEFLDTMKDEKVLGFNSNVRTVEIHGRIQRVLDRAIWKDGFKTVWKNHTLKDTHGPVILTDGHSDSTIWKSEIFGPIVCIKGYDGDDLNYAIDEINEIGYGLKCSIWTNRDNKLEISERVNCGSVHFNQMTIFDEPHLPHGGVGLSGNGRFNSVWGVRSFQYDKLVTGVS